MKPDDIAQEVCRRTEQLSNNRGIWESQWEEIAQLVLPSYSRTFHSRGHNTPGQPKTERQFDATAANALVRFASVMESMLTPRNSRWHRLAPSDKMLKKNRQVMLWFDEVADLLFQYRYAPKANFAGQQHEAYMALGAFGTGALFIDSLDPKEGLGLRYRAIHLGEVFFSENHQGIIDTAHRRFPMTARQAVQKFGIERVPPQVAEKVEKTPDVEFEFIHCVKPREEIDYKRADFRRMPFVSYYVAVTPEKKLISEGGYNTFPYPISRYVQAPGELYGRSPAMLALPDIKVINEQEKTILKQGHRIVDPVLLVHDDGVLSQQFSLRPGAINSGGVTADGRLLVHTLPTGNLAVAKDMMEAKRLSIQDTFLLTLFQILTESPRMTATEVIERTREKGALLSPTMGRQQSESLGPQIEREIDILLQKGLIPPMPPILAQAQGEYTIEYDSPLSRAQKAEEGAGLMRTVEMALQVVNVTQNPEPLDHFDWDVIVPELAHQQAVPARWMRTMAKIQEIRDGRAEQAETQTMIEAAPAAAGLMKATQ